jgi:hypothetical protein
MFIFQTQILIFILSGYICHHADTNPLCIYIHICAQHIKSVTVI